MMNARNIAALLALSALPACSMFGGGSGRQASSTAPASSQSYAYQQPQQQSYSSYSQPQELSPDTIKQVQTKLQQDGMYRGRVDGVWGPQTQAAVRQFQQQNNLNASGGAAGTLDQDTLSALNIGSNQNNANSQQPQSQRYGSNTNPSPNNGNANNNGNNYNPPANTNSPGGNTNNTNGTNTQR